jgi:hypothetical protein
MTAFVAGLMGAEDPRRQNVLGSSRALGRSVTPHCSALSKTSYLPLTLTAAPSESSNCASIPPYSRFSGATGNFTPFALISL